MEAAKASPVQLLVQQEKTASGDREEIAGIASRLDNLQVNEFLSFLPLLNDFFARQASNFKAGRLAAFLPTWVKITSDPEILHMVSGQHIEFSSEPVHITQPNKGVFSDKERLVITSEINTLLEKAVIVKAHHEPGEFISPIFVRPKKDGSHRMILNLKNLNTHVEYNHFKMDTLESAICLMTPGCYMASIDLRGLLFRSHCKGSSKVFEV